MYKSNLPDWYRTAGLEPNAEEMPTRIAAIEKFDPDAESLIRLVRLFYGIGEPSADFLAKWRLPFQEEDKVFSNRGNEAELAVLAGAKLIQIMFSPSNSHSEMAALAVACASCQGLRKNPCVPEIVQLTIKRLSEQTTERARMLSERSNSTLSQALGETEIPVLVNEVAKMGAQIQLVAEESNILWWLFAEQSRDESVRWDQLEFPAVLLMIGKELSDLIEVLPGPVAAPAFLDKVARLAKNKLPENVSLKSAINTLPQARRKKYSAQPIEAELETLMPLTQGIRLSLLSPQDDGWCSGFNNSIGIPADSTLTAQKLSFQFYLECLLSRAWSQSS